MTLCKRLHGSKTTETREDQKKHSGKDSKIKIDSTVAATAAVSTTTCESRPVRIVNDEGVWSASADERVSKVLRTVKAPTTIKVPTTVKMRWSLDSAYTIHLTQYPESFDTHEIVPIG